MRVEHESAISSDLFPRTAASNGISLQFSGIESHNYLSAGERYHVSLRRLFSILRLPHPRLHPEVCLPRSLNGMNDTMGPSGLVPTFLVFGSLPSFPVSSTDYPIHREWMLPPADRTTGDGGYSRGVPNCSGTLH